MQYREFADECERMAKESKNEQHRSILEEMAAVWRRLADEAEKKGRGKT
jgi:hypothetical protein